MITKENFIKVINKARSYENEIDKWDNFGIEIYNFPICQFHFDIFDIILNTLFKEEGVDWINWWLYERVGINEKILKAYDENNNEINLNTPEDLWNLVEKYRI